MRTARHNMLDGCSAKGLLEMIDGRSENLVVRPRVRLAKRGEKPVLVEVLQALHHRGELDAQAVVVGAQRRYGSRS